MAIKTPTKVFYTTYKAFLNKRPVIVQSGGTSSGKTYSILQALCTIASYNSVTISIVGEDIPNLMVGAYRDIQTIIASDEFYQQQITDHNKSRRQFTFKSGSIIEFGSRSDPQDAKSGKRDILFVNEANGVPYEIFEELQVRTSRLVIIDFNPTAEFWAHERLRPNPDVIWIDTTYKDNPFIEDSVRKKIESYEPTPENIQRGTANEYRWKVYGLGEVGRLEGLVFPEFKVDATFPADYKWRVFGMDFGYTNDPTTLIEIRYAEGKLYWRQHIYETGLTNPDIAERLKELDHPPGEVIIADSAEPKSIAELKRMGWHIKPAIKGTDSVMNGIDAIKRYPNVIHAGSRDLITEFNSYTWKKDRNGNAMNVPIDQYNHAIDAGRYALSHHLLKPKKDIEFYFA